MFQAGRSTSGYSNSIEPIEDASIPLSKGMMLSHITQNKTSEITKDSFDKNSFSRVNNNERSTEVMKDTSKRDIEYIQSSTKIQPQLSNNKSSNETNVQNTPTVINNYNTTNNNITIPTNLCTIASPTHV